MSNYAEKADDDSTGRRKIPARSFVDDMRSGMPDSALMEKYKLTARGLHSAFRKLLAANVIRASELEGRQSEYDETIDVDDIRALQRYKVEFPLPIYESDDPESCGIISDITVMGVGIKGFQYLKLVKLKNSRSPLINFFKWTRSSSEQGAAG